MSLSFPDFVLNVFRIHWALTVGVVILRDLLLIKSEQWLTQKAIAIQRDSLYLPVSLQNPEVSV